MRKQYGGGPGEGGVNNGSVPVACADPLLTPPSPGPPPYCFLIILYNNNRKILFYILKTILIQTSKYNIYDKILIYVFFKYKVLLRNNRTKIPKCNKKLIITNIIHKYK